MSGRRRHRRARWRGGLDVGRGASASIRARRRADDFAILPLRSQPPERFEFADSETRRARRSDAGDETHLSADAESDASLVLGLHGELAAVMRRRRGWESSAPVDRDAREGTHLSREKNKDLSSDGRRDGNVGARAMRGD
eukprot:29930-Pelagococcus_subviridis.AAC.6